MDFDAAAFVQYDLPAGVAALGCFDVTFVELAGEDGDASAEFDVLGARWPPMAPCVDGESVAWFG
jgi:hypothetical protein